MFYKLNLIPQGCCLNCTFCEKELLVNSVFFSNVETHDVSFNPLLSVHFLVAIAHCSGPLSRIRLALLKNFCVTQILVVYHGSHVELYFICENNSVPRYFQWI